ncbi:MAG: uracil-DNA glycosylase family protein [Candidatus Heimdallarchaeaceae archaeon]
MSKKFFKKSKEVDPCVLCGLCTQCKSPKMEPTGIGNKGIFILAEAPGKTEDEEGSQLIGEAGQRLRKHLRKLNIDIEDDCVKHNSISCRPPFYRTPTSKEIDCCRSRVFKEIEKFKPKLVILLGATAVESWWGDRFKEAGDRTVGGITKWRGLLIPDRKYRCWTLATFHPSYVLRTEHYMPIVERIFHYDLVKALNYPTFPMFTNEEDKVIIEEDPKKIIDYLKRINHKTCGIMGVDFETTGKKPYDSGHEIMCAAVATDHLHAFVFPTQDKRVRKILAKKLEDDKLPITAHNIKFEDLWSRVILGVEPKRWCFDTILSSHILDNRRSHTGLKWQSFVNYGVLGYDKEVSPYLKGDKGGNSFNKLKEVWGDEEIRRKVLLYCGMDAMLQTRLALDQMEEMGMWPWE